MKIELRSPNFIALNSFIFSPADPSVISVFLSEECKAYFVADLRWLEVANTRIYEDNFIDEKSSRCKSGANRGYVVSDRGYMQPQQKQPDCPILYAFLFHMWQPPVDCGSEDDVSLEQLVHLGSKHRVHRVFWKLGYTVFMCSKSLTTGRDSHVTRTMRKDLSLPFWHFSLFPHYFMLKVSSFFPFFLLADVPPFWNLLHASAPPAIILSLSL